MALCLLNLFNKVLLALVSETTLILRFRMNKKITKSVHAGKRHYKSLFIQLLM